jgi:hypothetical protein
LPTAPEQQQTAARYAAALEDLPKPDRDRRLQLMADFYAFVDRTADQMIEEVFDERTRKYKRRGFYTDTAREFAASRAENRNAQLQMSNVVRGPFISNGRRLLAKQPDWMRAT